jgi:hypothetical protein
MNYLSLMRAHYDQNLPGTPAGFPSDIKEAGFIKQRVDPSGT